MNFVFETFSSFIYLFLKPAMSTAGQNNLPKAGIPINATRPT